MTKTCYTITHNNSLKYTNTDGLTLNGQTGEIPEGYNFLLYFDGEKVTAVKGEKSLDVYGDGIYQEENDWYVPGYRNFQADNETAKAIVCIAATEKPIIYVRGSYTDGQTDWQVNRLYYLAQG